MWMKDQMNWILSSIEAMSRNAEQHTSSLCQQARKERAETSCQRHLIASFTCETDKHFGNEPFPSSTFRSVHSLLGEVQWLQWPALCKHLGGFPVLPGIAFKIFRFSAQITSVIQIKAEGNEEAPVSGIPWISLKQPRAEPGPSSVVISTATPGFQSDKGPFIATSEPYGVLCKAQQGAKKQAPWWHWIEPLQTGQLLQHPSYDMHCHSTSAALVVLNQGQLPPELPASRPDSGRFVLWRRKTQFSFATSLPCPSTFPSGLCQPKNFPWDADHSWLSPNHLTPLKKKIQSMLAHWYYWWGTWSARSNLTLPLLCWLHG